MILTKRFDLVKREHPYLAYQPEIYLPIVNDIERHASREYCKFVKSPDVARKNAIDPKEYAPMSKRENEALTSYLHELYGDDNLLAYVTNVIAKHGMPPISVAPPLGRLLTLLARTANASNILEIGTLAGYSAVCLARGLPATGRLTALEVNPDFAKIAQETIRHFGYASQAQIRVGDALDQLQAWQATGVQLFDFIFIDADKGNYPHYLDFALQLCSDGAIVVADNVLLGNRVCDPLNDAPSPTTMRGFNQELARHPHLFSTILPLYDGFAIARVSERSACNVDWIPGVL